MTIVICSEEKIGSVTAAGGQDLSRSPKGEICSSRGREPAVSVPMTGRAAEQRHSGEDLPSYRTHSKR